MKYFLSILCLFVFSCDSGSDDITKVNLSYAINNDTMMYVTFAEGYRPGGANRTTQLGATYDADFLESKGLRNISLIINVFSIVSDLDQDDFVAKTQIEKIHVQESNGKNKSSPEIVINDNFERELVLITCLYFNPKRLNEKEYDSRKTNLC